MSFLKKLQARWNLPSNKQVLIVLLIFALTGFTVMFLKRPVVAWIAGGEQKAWMTILYYILILPIYNVILLFYGLVFGQFKFFWNFEKRMFSKLSSKKQPSE